MQCTDFHDILKYIHKCLGDPKLYNVRSIHKVTVSKDLLVLKGVLEINDYFDITSEIGALILYSRSFIATSLYGFKINVKIILT